MLTATGIRKSFGGVQALAGVDFDVQRGEIHGLAGENGAGKSTLIKVLAGAVAPDSGSVVLDGSSLVHGDAPRTRALGISCVHQEFTLVPDLDIADNIFLGRERGRWFVRRDAQRREAHAHLEALGVSLEPRARVAELSVAQQQLVEIARATAADARVLILDEPTASLGGDDVDRLFTLLRRLRDAGVAIVYISHRLDEIFELATRVTVLRDGRTVATSAIDDVDRGALIRWMVGRELAEEFPSRMVKVGRTVLEVEELSAAPRFENVSFTLRAGEVVGIAGLVGAGRTSLGLALAGAIRAEGTIRLGGTPLVASTPAEALRAGVAYVTEDRKALGIFPQMTTAANVTIASLGRFVTGGLLSPSLERADARAAMTDFRVRAASIDETAATLSGGNQQKLLLARFFRQRRSVVILDEPTRGVDVGARAEIYGLVNRLTGEGLGVLMISSDLHEILGMSDRVLVMRQGTIVGELTRTEATAERVMRLATGVAA